MTHKYFVFFFAMLGAVSCVYPTRAESDHTSLAKLSKKYKLDLPIPLESASSTELIFLQALLTDFITEKYPTVREVRLGKKGVSVYGRDEVSGLLGPVRRSKLVREHSAALKNKLQKDFAVIIKQANLELDVLVEVFSRDDDTGAMVMVADRNFKPVFLKEGLIAYDQVWSEIVNTVTKTVRLEVKPGSEKYSAGPPVTASLETTTVVEDRGGFITRSHYAIRLENHGSGGSARIEAVLIAERKRAGEKDFAKYAISDSLGGNTVQGFSSGSPANTVVNALTENLTVAK